MKKIRSAAALLILAAMLAGCGQTPSSGSETTDVTAPSDTTEEVTEYAPVSRHRLRRGGVRHS